MSLLWHQWGNLFSTFWGSLGASVDVCVQRKYLRPGCMRTTTGTIIMSVSGWLQTHSKYGKLTSDQEQKKKNINQSCFKEIQWEEICCFRSVNDLSFRDCDELLSFFFADLFLFPFILFFWAWVTLTSPLLVPVTFQ